MARSPHLPGAFHRHPTSARLGETVLVWICLLPAAWPIALPGFLVTDDGLEHVFRAWAIGQRIAAGDLLPHWLPEFGLGHGYPLFYAYPPGAAYLLAVLGAATGFLAALDWLTVVCLLALGSGSYWLIRDRAGRIGGLIAAVATVYAPYTLLDAITRGSLPELAAIAGLPWALIAVDRAIERPGRTGAAWIAVLAAIVAGLVWIHPIAIVYLAPLGGAVAAARLIGRDSRTIGLAIGRIALAGIAAAGLTALYWLPAAEAAAWLQPGPQSAADTLGWNFRSPADLIADWQRQIGPAALDRWLENAARAPGDTRLPDLTARSMAPFPLTIAAAAAGLAFAGRRGGRDRRWAIGLAAAGGLTFALTLTLSRPIWEAVPATAAIQFPWRLFGPAAIAIGLLAGWAPTGLAGRTRVVLGVGLAAAIAAGGLGTIAFGRYPIAEAAIDAATVHRRELIGHLGTATGPGQVLPRWVADPAALGDPTADLAGEPAPVPAIRALAIRDQALRLDLTAPAPTRIVLPRFYFPNWSITVDGVPAAGEPTEPDGLLAIPIAAGDRRVEVTRRETPGEIAAAAITALTLAAGLTALLGAVAGRPAAAAGLVGTLAVLAIVRGAPIAPAGIVFEPVSPPGPPTGAPRVAAARIELRPDRLTIHTAWQTGPAAPAGSAYRVRLLDAAGHGAVARVRRPIDGAFPPGRWPAGRLLTDAVDLPLPERPGPRRVEIAWLDGASPPQTVATLDLPAGPPPPAESPPPAPIALAATSIQTTAPGARFDRNGRPLDRRIAPGSSILARLDWLPAGDIPEDFEPVLQILGPDRRRVAATAVDRLATLVLTTLWRTGRTYPVEYQIDLPADAQPGVHELVAGFFRPSPDRHWPVHRPPDPPADTLVVARFAVPQRDLPSPRQPIAVRFGDTLDLTGFDAPAAARPGETVDLTLWWRAAAAPDRDLAITWQIHDPAGRLIAQHDGPPRAGAYPTGYLAPGDALTDPRAIRLPPDLPPGAYPLLIGVYDPATGARLPPTPADRADGLVEIGRVGVGTGGPPGPPMLGGALGNEV